MLEPHRSDVISRMRALDARPPGRRLAAVLAATLLGAAFGGLIAALVGVALLVAHLAGWP